MTRLSRAIFAPLLSIILLGTTFSASAYASSDSTADQAKKEVNELSQSKMGEDEVEALESAATLYVQSMKENADTIHQKKFWDGRVANLIERKESIASLIIDYSQELNVANAAYEKTRSSMASFIREKNNSSLDGMSKTAEALLIGPDAMMQVANTEHASNKTQNVLAKENLQKKVDAENLELIIAESKADLEKVKSELADAEGEASAAAHNVTTSTAQLKLADAEWSKASTSAPLTAEGITGVSVGAHVLNKAVTKEWKAYLKEIRDAGIKLPKQESLMDTGNFPKNLEHLPAVQIDNIVGVAMAKGIIVPTQESADRTTAALDSLNAAYSPTEDSDTELSCEALISRATGVKGDLNKAYEESGRQLSTVDDVTSGDIVFFADDAKGIHQAGVYVFGGLAVTSSAATNSVGIEVVDNPIGAVRPINKELRKELDLEFFNVDSPLELPSAMPWKCGGLDFANSDEKPKGDAWLTPFPKDAYKIETNFSSDSKFMDFVIKEQSPVRAAFAGQVSAVTTNEGTVSVTVRHTPTFSTRVSGLSATGLSEGARIDTGAALGLSGERESESEGYGFGVRFELLSGVEAIDPNHMFFPERFEFAMFSVKAGEKHRGAIGSNGGFSNGHIPASALCVTDAGGMLRCDATKAFNAMNAAYKAHFGSNISITDHYRSYAGQVACRAAKGNMCANPGFSNHGWGLALDLGGGINRFGTPTHEWMRANAPRFGWVNPAWAQRGGSNPEAWHWEFQGGN